MKIKEVLMVVCFLAFGLSLFSFMINDSQKHVEKEKDAAKRLMDSCMSDGKKEYECHIILKRGFR